MPLLTLGNWVLDVGQVGDEGGGLDQRGVGVPAGDDHVLLPGTVPERLQYVFDRDPSPLDGVGELVEHIETVGLSGQVALDLLPALAGVPAVVLLGVGPLAPLPALPH